jgi:hypothetical protein
MRLVEELGADPRTLAANDLDPLNPFSVDPILVEVPAPAIGGDMSICRP